MSVELKWRSNFLSQNVEIERRPGQISWFKLNLSKRAEREREREE